jgi:hypothetical protein
MGAILRLIRMDTTLQGPMFMHTRDPIVMHIHIGIMAPTIPTEAHVEPHDPPSAAVFARAYLMCGE